MIIADVDDLKKSRRVLFTISLLWIALVHFKVDLTGIEIAGIKFSITMQQAELSLLTAGLYTLVIFLAYSYDAANKLYQKIR